MGVVYAAWDPTLGRRVAVKVLTGRSERALARFEREARALGRMSHPNVVPVHLAGLHQGLPFVAMELVEGESLEALLARAGRLDEEAALRLGLGLARALAHAHAHGVVHRDVKPANVLLGPDGAPRLTDFGLALDLDDAGRLSQSGVSLGSPAWWAPEQAAGERDRVGPATDVFGLGATLFHALTGQPPYAAESLMEAVGAALQGAPPVRSVRPAVRADVAAVVDRCLARDPAARYPSMEAVAAALEATLAGASASGRRRAPPWLVGAAALGAVGAAFAVGRTTTGARPDSPAAVAPEAPAGVTAPTPADALAPTPGALEPTAGPAPATPGAGEPAEAPAPPAADEPSGAPGAGEDLRALLARVEALGAARRFEEALPLAREAAARAPDDARAALLLGLVLEDLRRDAEAIPALERALALGAPPAARARLGRALINTGRLHEALAALDQVLAEAPGHFEAWTDRAIAKLNLERFEEALADAERAVALGPGWSEAHFARCAALVRLGRFAEALPSADRALELVSTPHPELRRMRGIALAQLERYAEAIVDFTIALDAGGFPPATRAELHANRGYCRAVAGDRAGARADYDRALALRPGDPGTLRKRATLAIVEGRVAEGLADVERLLAADPRDGVARGLRGAVRVDEGRWGEALEDLDVAVAAEPGSAMHRVNRCVALLELGRLEEADAEATAALARGPVDRRPLVLRARIRAALGRPAEAVEDASRAIAEGSTTGFAHLARAAALVALGRKDEARRDLDYAEPRVGRQPRFAERIRALRAACDAP